MRVICITETDDKGQVNESGGGGGRSLLLMPYQHDDDGDDGDDEDVSLYRCLMCCVS